MKKLSKIIESLWADIQSQASGSSVKKEDDIDNFSIEQFCEYLFKHYPRVRPGGDIELTDTKYDNKCIIVRLFEMESGFDCCLFYYEDKTITTQFVGLEELGCRLDVETDYATKEYRNDYRVDCIDIAPKDGSPVTNSFFIEVLDYLLSKVKKPIIRKVDNVTESLWAEIQNQAAGTTRKKEDEVINQYGKKEMYDYIYANYEGDFNIFNYQYSTLVPIALDDSKWLIYAYMHYYNGHPPKYLKKFTLTIDESCKELVQPMLDKFPNMLPHKITENHCYDLTLDDDNNLTNCLFIDILNTAIDLVEELSLVPNAKRKLSRKVNESLRADVQSQASGETTKKEDEVGNVRNLKPVDMGGSVLWADKDIIIDGGFHFNYSDTENIVHRLAGWRLPTVHDVAELDDIDYYFDDFHCNFKAEDGTILTFSLMGCIYRYGGNLIDDNRIYYGWTSTPCRGSDSMHIFMFDKKDEEFAHSPATNPDRSIAEEVTENKEDKLCIRLVKDK